MLGTLIKGYSGFYYVFAEEKTWTCSVRGRFKKKGEQIRFLPGDTVRISPVEADRSIDRGVIEELLPRRNELIRPPIANVDKVFLVFALFSPEPDLNLVDRLIVLAIHAGIEPVLVWNKVDLAPADFIAEVKNSFEKTGINQYFVSAQHGLGTDGLKEEMRRKISVLAGPSGVGKSSLLNALSPGLQLKTGEVSQKIGRGRHTTRHVELLPLPFNALVADTPGFSSLFLPEMEPLELANCFPEMTPYLEQCRFTSCLHVAEPDCGVKAAFDEGKIHHRRYRSYQILVKELLEKQERKY